MLRDGPEDVRQYIKNLSDGDFYYHLGCEVWLDAALNEYGWVCDESADELWVNEYNPEITFHPRKKELIIPVQTEPSEPMEEVKWEDICK